ncbi:hypothetical protein C2E20_1867 [Micractinium conductrix]|uniref:C3H1-type domain-containing protein n=1 Tax=Micractinium conductrix TaxID=554055 RepID=A0A2P6VLR5_9CHLO|nr:hypothetical protein C2E20_1867 [Micractinium conductrix]|eukprot:PSC75029.1 hypothetical protein C2E20_1867 [Micractinium conductrix]
MQPSGGGRREGGAAGAAAAAAASGQAALAAAPGAPRAAPAGSNARLRAGRAAVRPGATASGGLQPLQQKLQQHIDREDRRIKELTEGILYDFFPAALRALLPPGADPAGGLPSDAARSVAAAALTVATLMNAPPGFLEFLLCVPWASLGSLYLRPEREEEGGGELEVPQLLTSQSERAALVNARLDPALLDCVLDFLYREQHQESLPPMIKLTAAAGAVDEQIKGLGDTQTVTRETVGALLDGATVLHCAALRGNPAQVDHLLLCGADPLLPNAAGELPVEAVPVCGDRCLGNGKLSCRCMGVRDQEAWECRSRLARSLILRRCVMQFRNGVSAWLRTALLCLLCVLGFWGHYTTLCRPALEQHATRRAEARRKRLLQQTQAKLLSMRTHAASGRRALGDGGAGAAAEPPDPHESSGGSGDGTAALLPPQPPADAADSYACSVALPGDARAGSYCSEDYAYACFSRAAQLLKELDLQPGSTPAGFVEAAAAGAGASATATRVLPAEQAAIYCGWAEAALRKARACTCAGCAAVAMHAVATGQHQVAALLASPDLAGEEEAQVAWLGASMARLVHCKAVLVLQTDVRQSATRAGIWRAQQCLQEWERLQQLGMTAGLGEDSCLDLQCLEGWCRSAGADLLLLESLRGAPLQPLQPLAEALPQAVGCDPASGVPTLLRPAGRDVVQQLRSALAAARPHASDHVVRVAESVASNLQAELSAGDRLRDLLLPRSGGMNVDELGEAIRAAERYPSLAAEVEQARGLKERWMRRAEAQAQFDAAVESMSGPPEAPLLVRQPGVAPAVVADAFWAELNSRVQQLESATEEARQANIGVAKAKRLLKELQAQGAAVEAAARLDEALSQPRCTSSALKTALAKAEAAAAAAAPGACLFVMGAELLQPRISAAKQKLEVERAAEGLARAASSCKAVADLPRLEAAILAARKVGAQELDQEAYKAASELRLRLDGASRARGALEAALRSLQKLGRQDDADGVERCIEEAEQCGELLTAEAARAREAVQRWRAAVAAEARLTRALSDGVGTAHLSRAIKEAAAAGVKVGEARRLLKLMQGLEAAMQQAAEGPFQYQAFKSRIEQAEAGGCPEGLVGEAKLQLHRLLLAEVAGELDAALKLSRTADKSVVQRLSSLKAVLDKADAVLQMDGELQAQQVQQHPQQPGVAASSTSEPSEAGASEAAAGGAGEGRAPQAPSLSRSDTGLSGAGSGSAGALGRAEPGSGSSSLPPGLGSVSRLESFASDQGSPRAATAAGAPSVYVSAAPSVQLDGGDADVAVLLEVMSEGRVQLSILLPAAAVLEGEDEDASDVELPEELAGDQLAVVKHMVRQARRLLAREEAEQARIERERQEEARVRREQQLREKAERERADRERAEKARAERAERKAALEAQKAERRERERQHRLEKERQRQEREKLAKEHFALLQKQRRLLAQPPAPSAAQPEASPLPMGGGAPAAGLGQAAAQPLGAPMVGGGGGGLFALPGPGGAAGGLVPSAAALELWAAAHAGGAASAAGFARLPGLLRHVEHDRSDSLERLSEQQGLLDLLNDHSSDAAPAAEAPGASRDAAGAGGEPLHSPTSGGGGGGLRHPAFGSGRWSSMEGSTEGLPGTDVGRTPEASPIKQRSLAAAAGGAGFLDFANSLWQVGGASGGAGAPRAAGVNSGSGGALLWGSSGNLAAASTASPSRLSVQDDLALTGLGSSRLWQSGGADRAAGPSSGDGWAEVLGGAVQQQGGAGSSLLASPQRGAPQGAGGGGDALGGGGLGVPALALLQQRRQQQLIAALDAAKAQLLLQHQGGRQTICKYFMHGFCREGDACRFSHSIPGALADQQQQQQRLLGLQRLSAGAPAAQQQQPGGGGVLSFGAPGAAAFAGGGSASGSRAGTPDIRMGGAAAGGGLPASGSSFSVTAPSFSPREPLSGASSAAAAAAAAVGGFPPSTASLPAFAGLGAAMQLDSYSGGRFAASRPASAANSAFATPRDDPRLSAEGEAFEDALESQTAPLAGGGDGGYGGGEAELYQEAYAEGGEEYGDNGEAFQGSGGTHGYHPAAYRQPRLPGDAYAAPGAGAGDGGGDGDGGAPDAFGLPSEASLLLFRDLPDFLHDTTDE